MDSVVKSRNFPSKKYSKILSQLVFKTVFKNICIVSYKHRVICFVTVNIDYTHHFTQPKAFFRLCPPFLAQYILAPHTRDSLASHVTQLNYPTLAMYVG